MTIFSFKSKIVALLASTVLVGVRGQCDLPVAVAYFAAIGGFESVAPLYCSSDDATKAFYEYALGQGLARGESFIATCMWQILPNFQNHVQGLMYPECPPAGETGALSSLTDAIEPTYLLDDGSLYSYKGALDGGFLDGVSWCLNFDICKRDDFIEYMTPVTTAFNQDWFDGRQITSFHATTVSCFKSLQEPLTCYDKDETISECDNKLLLDTTIGSDEPFSIAICNDECGVSVNKSQVANIASYFLTERDCFCLPQDTTTSVEYSSEAFQLENYCEANAIKARDGRCTERSNCKKAPKGGKAAKAPKMAKSSKAPKAGKSSKAPKATKAPKAAKSSKAPKADKSSKAPKADKVSKAPKAD